MKVAILCIMLIVAAGGDVNRGKTDDWSFPHEDPPPRKRTYIGPAEYGAWKQAIKDIDAASERAWEQAIKDIDAASERRPISDYPVFISAGTTQSAEKPATGRALVKHISLDIPMQEMTEVVYETNRRLRLLEPSVQMFYKNNVEVSIQKSNELVKATPGSNPWMSEIRKRVTASTAHRLSQPGNDNPYEKYYRHLLSPPGNFQNFDAAIISYELVTGHVVFNCGLIVRPELPWLAASPDGLVYDDELKRIVRIIKISTVDADSPLGSNASQLLEAHVMTRLNEESNQLKRETDHYTQVQINMLLSGVSECDYIIYSEKGGDFFMIRIKLNPSFAVNVASRLSSVYFSYILPGIVKAVSKGGM